MANLDELDPNLDPVVRAAMITQPTDSEEEKSTKSVDDQAESSVEEKKDPEQQEPEKKETEQSEEKVESKETPEKQESKEELDPDPEQKKTRKEKRAERKAYLDSIRREQEKKAERREQRFETDPNYKPIEFDNKEYDHKELEEDRTKYGQNEFAKGAKTAAETEQWYAEQDKFWQATEYESKLLEKDPEFAFLDESNSETYDPDRTAELNEAYLALVGYDPEKKTVGRTDISYEKFVRFEVDRVKRWAEELFEQQEKNIVEQKSQTSIRPNGGTAPKSLGQLKPGDISKMTDEEYEKNKDEINRQILASL